MKDAIKNRDIWQFIQSHRNEPRDQFLLWLVSQSVNPTNKIMKAIMAWNEGEDNDT